MAFAPGLSIALPLAAVLLASTALAAPTQGPLIEGAVTSTTGTPRVTIVTAAIVAGKLVIIGRASSPGVVVGIEGTNYTDTANSEKLFGFNIDYRTPDCRVTLTTSTGTLELMIGMCGPQGESGVAGPQGIMGPTGPRGEPGPAGEAGAQGETGPAGAQGEGGPRGEQGPQGERGDIGQAGPAGPQGETGPHGETGPQGERGPAGSQGPQGVAGADGAAGPQGGQGAQGPARPQGPIGPQGPAGARTFARSENMPPVTLTTQGSRLICSVQITTNGECVYIAGNTDFLNDTFNVAGANAPNIIDVSVEVRRGGLGGSPIDFPGYDIATFSQFQSASFFATDTPPAGTHTYVIQAGERSTSVADIRALDCRLWAHQ